jgi:hypothetical protein
MKKKPPSGPRLPVSNPSPHKTVLNWRNIPERDLCFHARSFHKAAKTLAGSLQRPFTDSDVSPIVFTYRRALELHLKALPSRGWSQLLGDQARRPLSSQDPFGVLAGAVCMPDRDRRQRDAIWGRQLGA